MEPSVPGILVFLALLALGFRLRAPIIIGLFGSLAFGSTAIVTLPALGGSSPMVYTGFLLLLIGSTVMRHGGMDAIGAVFTKYWVAGVLAALIIYAIDSAIIFPRLFAGSATAIVASPTGISELPLGPVSGNITQTGYFVAGALAFYAFAILLPKEGTIRALRRGFITFAVLNACLGILDLAGKLIGVGDILAPIRTASYVNLVEVEEAGFWRIAGGFSEASAFGAVTLSCLAYTYADWRISRAPYMLVLAIVLFVLVIFSTSSTAYAGLAMAAPFAAASIAVSALRGRLSAHDLVLLGLLWAAGTAVLLLFLMHEQLFQPFTDLIDRMVFQKSASGSALVRLYWNQKSLEAFYSTMGVGIGLGSSRTSSWAVAVLSQLGIVGGFLMALLVAVLIRDMLMPMGSRSALEAAALRSGARSATLTSLCAASLSSGFADPGLIFFITLAIVVAGRGSPLPIVSNSSRLRWANSAR
jgi:hypothetical protein